MWITSHKYYKCYSLVSKFQIESKHKKQLQVKNRTSNITQSDAAELTVEPSEAGRQGAEKERSTGKRPCSVPGRHPLSFKINEATNMAQSVILRISKITEEEIW